MSDDPEAAHFEPPTEEVERQIDSSPRLTERIAQKLASAATDSVTGLSGEVIQNVVRSQTFQAALASNLGVRDVKRQTTVQVTAAGVLVIAFVGLGLFFMEQFKETAKQAQEQQRQFLEFAIGQVTNNQSMFRSELAVMHQDSQQKWAAINAQTQVLNSQMQVLNDLRAEMKQNREVMTEMLKRLKTAPPDACPVPEPGPVLPAWLRRVLPVCA